MKKIYFIFSLLLLSVSSCYDDLGNYAYHDINDIIISMKKSFSAKIPLRDSALVRVPVSYSQVIPVENNKNLTFEWSMKKSGETDWRVCGTDSVLSFYIYPNDPNRIDLRVAVTDTYQDIMSYGEITLNLTHAFDPAWFVLQNIDNKAVLGVVDGKQGAVTITHDIYKAETGNELMGAPKGMYMNIYHSVGDILSLDPQDIPMLQIYTDQNQYILDGGDLTKKLYDYDRMLLKKKIDGDSNFQPWFTAGDYGGECIIDNGQFWFAFDDACSIYYPVAAEDGDYKATMADLSYTRGVKIVFDDMHKRFLSYTPGNMAGMWNTHRRIAQDNNYSLYDPDNKTANGTKLQKITESAYAPNQFDPNNIGGDKSVVFMGPEYDRTEPNVLAVARNAGKSNILYVYELCPKAISGDDMNQSYCPGMWEVTAEGDVSGKDIKIASSSFFNRMFFYVAGNKLYRVDLNRTVPAVFEIYTAPEGFNLTNIRFQSAREDFGYEPEDGGANDDLIMIEYPLWMGLVASDAEGKCALIELKLNKAGDIATDKETKQKMVYVYQGTDENPLRNIQDFVYSFRH